MVSLLEDLLEWTEPKAVGSRTTQMCYTVTDEFWELWKEHKDEIKELGIRSGRDDDNGQFYLTWVRRAESDRIPEPPPEREEKVVRFLKCPPAMAIARGYPTQLHPDQRDAVWTLESAIAHFNRFTIDASEPGIGKTWIALAVAKALQINFAIICPASVVTKWTDTAISDPFNLEPEFVLSYDKLRSGRTDYVSRFLKMRGKKKIHSFEWNLEDKVMLIFDEVHMCSGDKSLNSLLLKAAIDNPFAYVHGASATCADSPLDMKAIGYGLGLHDFKGFWAWLHKVGCRRGHFGGMIFSTGSGPKEPTVHQRRARVALTKIHAHTFPKRGVRITVGDSELWRPKNQIFAELVDVDEKHPKIQDALRIIDEKENADFEKAEEKEVEVSPLTFNTRDRQRAELFKLPILWDRVSALRISGYSVIVFLNYRLAIETLLGEFIDEESSVIVGGLNDKQRDVQMGNFQRNLCRICICQTDAGSQSIDLDDQDGNFPRRSLISCGYDAKKLYQALGRAYRPASTRSHVMQWLLFATGTIEERVGRLVQPKLNGQALINDGDLRGGIDISPK